MDRDTDWTRNRGGIFPPKVLAESPNGRSQIVSATAWVAPYFARTILVLDGEPIPGTLFHTRSGRPAINGYDERTRTWHGTCLTGDGRRGRWWISLDELEFRFVEDSPDASPNSSRAE
jgi:hypothetical protein